MSILSPEFLSRLETLQLQSRFPLVGRFGGDHRSRRHGNTVDFADFREYKPGDDFRRIDYHVLARLDQVFIKLFEADDEVTVRLLIDTSASMAVGDKMGQARRIAAALGFVALVSHDAVTVHTFPETGRIPRFTGRAGSAPFFGHLERLEPSGPTPFAAAAGRLLSRAGPTGITVVLSDLLTPEWRHLMQLRAGGSHLIVAHILSEEDTDPKLAGDLMLIDREQGDRLTVSVTDEIIDTYRRRVTEWQQDVKQRCLQVGAAYVPVDAAADIEDLLLGSWRASGVLR